MGQKMQEGYISKATLNNFHVSPRKARLVVDLVRGRNVGEAVDILSVSPKKSAVQIKKLLLSAVSNVPNNSDVNVDDLFVKRAWVNEGRVLKRFMPRAHGRATKLLKRHSSITVVLDER